MAIGTHTSNKKCVVPHDEVLLFMISSSILFYLIFFPIFLFFFKFRSGSYRRRRRRRRRWPFRDVHDDPATGLDQLASLLHLGLSPQRKYDMI